MDKYIQFLGEENIREVEEFLGDRLTEKIVDSDKGSMLTHITLRTPDGMKTVPVGAYLVRNPTGTVTPYLEVTDVKKIGDVNVVPM